MLLFAGLRERAGLDELVLDDLPAGATSVGAQARAIVPGLDSVAPRSQTGGCCRPRTGGAKGSWPKATSFAVVSEVERWRRRSRTAHDVDALVPGRERRARRDLHRRDGAPPFRTGRCAGCAGRPPMAEAAVEIMAAARALAAGGSRRATGSATARSAGVGRGCRRTTSATGVRRVCSSSTVKAGADLEAGVLHRRTVGR
jgi:hypothetical protein